MSRMHCQICDYHGVEFECDTCGKQICEDCAHEFNSDSVLPDHKCERCADDPCECDRCTEDEDADA